MQPAGSVPGKRGRQSAKTWGARKLERLREQDGIYGLLTRGLQNGRKIEEELWIPVFSEMIDPYAEWGHFLSVAELDSLEIIVSNTTEAGLVYQFSDWNPSEAPMSFPAKLTMLLYRRYERYEGSPDKGLLILPCECWNETGISCDRLYCGMRKIGDFRRLFGAGLRNATCF